MAASSNLAVPEPKPKPSPTIADNVRGFVKSWETFVRGAFRGISGSSSHHHHHPADIMKRLQRETFSDVMKLRDGQEQIERAISFYKHSKGFPFQDVSTRVKAVIDVVGALFFVDDNFKQARESLNKLGNGTGLSSRFVFESKARQKDTVAAELATRLDALDHLGEAIGRPLELTRLQYRANINNWLSMILIPLGAQCNNFRSDSSLRQAVGSRVSLNGPPSFGQYHNCAAGLTIKGSNLTASLAELIFGSDPQDNVHAGNSRVTTFGQVSYELVEEVKISLSGLWQICRSSSRLMNLRALAIPLGSLKTQANTVVPVSSLSGATTASESRSVQSIAVMLDAEFYETTKVEGWVQVERPSPGSLQWGFSLSDTPEHELGWGLRTGGMAKGKENQLHMEGFLNFNLGRGAKLQPGLVYVMEGEKRTPALVLRSSWFM